MSIPTPSSNHPFALTFLFKHKGVDLPNPETVMSEPGSIAVRVDINGAKYGPYDTGIKTTLGVYIGRSDLQPTDEMKAVDHELYKFINFVHRAHSDLSVDNASIDGLMFADAVRQLKDSPVS